MRTARWLRAPLVALTLTLTLAPPALADERPVSAAPAGEEKGSSVEIHGFLLGSFSGRTTGRRPPDGDGGDYVLAEERVRLVLSGAVESADVYFVAKADLWHDAIARKAEVDLREGYAGYSKGRIDLRLGRQIITWGVGDLFFVNDIFPKDWESYFSGRPTEYLKLGVDGVRTRYSSRVLNAEFVAIPFFAADNLPSPKRFLVFDPLAAVPHQREDKPGARYANTELALRLYRQWMGLDVSVYGYRGFWRTPGVRLDDRVAPTTATRFYPTLSVYGASAQRGLAGGILSLEAGYYDSRQDRPGRDPSVPNSQWRFLVGYQRQPWADFTVGLQLYGELMDQYGAYRASLPAGNPRLDRFRGMVSTRLTQWLDYQMWMLSFFAAYSPTDRDYFLRPEASYKVTDALSASVGANIFGGRHEWTFFGQFRRSDNVFVTLRFDF